MSSQPNEARAGADRSAAAPGAVDSPGTADPQPGPSGPSMPEPSGPKSPGPVSGGPVSGAAAPGRQAFGGPLPGSRNPWKESADGRTVFRRIGPIVLWWAWAAFALFNLIDVVIPDHDYFSIEFAAGLLTVTGVAYATTLRPRVLATPDGLEVENPLRDHVIRWGALNGVYLGDAVELSCARPQPRKGKTIYCWALYSGRRSRMKSQQLGVRSWTRTSRSGTSSEPAGPDTAELIAAELGRRSTSAREAGVAAATLESRWAWMPIGLIVIPALALLVLVLSR